MEELRDSEQPRTARFVDAALSKLHVENTVEGGQAVLTVHGDLDWFTCDQLARDLLAVASSREAQRAAVVVDLADVASVDTSGLRMLVTSSARLRMTGQGLTLRAPSASVLSALEEAGFSYLVEAKPMAQPEPRQ